MLDVNTLLNEGVIVDSSAEEIIQKENFDTQSFLSFIRTYKIKFVDAGVVEKFKKVSPIVHTPNEEYEYKEVKVTASNVEVSEWVNLLKSRYEKIKKIFFDNHYRIDSINQLKNKVGEEVRVVGLISNVRNKNDHTVFDLEDPFDSVICIIDKRTVIDGSIAMVSGKYTGKFLIAENIIYPDVVKRERKSSIDGYVAFISDIHVGSKLFAKDLFLKFIKWLNGEIEEYKDIASKIRYLFILGDTVDGVGVYPEQQSEIEMDSVSLQYNKLAEYLSQIRKDIKIFMIPGNHDASHGALPQPPPIRSFASKLYEIPNLVLLYNPSFLRLKLADLNVIAYHGNSVHYFIDQYPSLGKMTRDDIATVLKFLLQSRHLAPVFGSTQVLPLPEDYLVIDNVPDILGIGDTHKALITKYKDTILLNSGCWQFQTEYMKKLGVEPDLGKVPIVDINSKEYTILDFEKNHVSVFEEGMDIKFKQI